MGRTQGLSGRGGEAKQYHHCPHRELNPGRSARSPGLYTDEAFPGSISYGKNILSPMSFNLAALIITIFS